MIQGAIFDCDGTILDSMPMWTDMCVGLLERYGVPDARTVFLEHESLDMDKKCYWYHDNLGIGESGESLYRELWEMVEHAYRNDVRPFAGAKEFLEKLRAAQIPLVIASSTPPELLRVALSAHGLDGFFDELVFAGDVGRGKEHPDVYLAARERLGTPREGTWVFEDAPFGMRSAARAGFPVVGLLNDHDGRDEAFVATWATCVARGYGELAMEDLRSLSPKVLDVLVVGGSPQPSSPDLVGRLAREADYVIATDRGAAVLRAAKVMPDLFCGDEDSADDQTLAWVHGQNIQLDPYNPEKDDTDLGLALSRAREQADARGCALSLTLTCVSGARPDHELGVFGVLGRNASGSPHIVEDGFEAWILSREGQSRLTFDEGPREAVSVISLEPVSVVSERGMHWELDHAKLALLDDLGISNRIEAKGASVECHAGVVIVFRR